MSEPIRILVVDDHALFRRGLADCLAEAGDFEIVGEAEDGQQAVDLCKELMPDLILMDILMPNCGGLEAARRIKEENPGVKIVMLTVSEEDRNLFEAIKSGAEGYLIKDVKPAELRRMLRGIWAGEAPISPCTATRILREFARRARPEADGASLAGLTPREREVLELVAGGQSNREIATALFVTEHTVKKHLRNILEKLHLQNRVEAAVYALQHGMVAGRPRPRPQDESI